MTLLVLPHSRQRFFHLVRGHLVADVPQFDDPWTTDGTFQKAFEALRGVDADALAQDALDDGRPRPMNEAHRKEVLTVSIGQHIVILRIPSREFVEKNGLPSCPR